jgi:beta-N-acetylhexosaminidase
MVSFRGHTAPEWVLDALRRGSVGAVCLFRYNFASLEQLRALNVSLMAAAAEGGFPPPIIGIDQEGGQLMAVTDGATELPGNMALGAVAAGCPVPTGEEAARATGAVLGVELLALGCNMNFAPVLDLATRPESDVMGVRVFGSDPDLAGRLGAQLIVGMQSTGVLATAKHFPGHGDTRQDSHHGAPVIDAPLATLARGGRVPVRAPHPPGVAAVMTCHAYYPAIDPDAVGTHSRAVLGDLLRGELDFDGLVITDALDMHAFGAMSGVERARRAVAAGADLALLGHLEGQAEIVQSLLGSADAASSARVMAVRERLPRELPPLAVIGSELHREVARATAEAAVTTVRGEPRLASLDSVLVVSVDAGDLTPAETTSGQELGLADALRAHVAEVTEVRFPRGANTGEIDAAVARVARWCGARAAAGEPGEVVVATINASGDEAQLALLRRLAALGADPVLVAMRSPLDVAVAEHVGRAICTYGRRTPQAEAAARVLCGQIPATGALPVALPEGVRARA